MGVERVAIALITLVARNMVVRVHAGDAGMACVKQVFRGAETAFQIVNRNERHAGIVNHPINKHDRDRKVF